MVEFLEQTDDLHILVRIFLAVFVLIAALVPSFSKRLSQVRNYFDSLRRFNTPGMTASLRDLDNVPSASVHMTDIEYFVFTRLAQAGSRGMSPATLAKRLHMDRAVIGRALLALHRRVLIRIASGFSMSGG